MLQPSAAVDACGSLPFVQKDSDEMQSLCQQLGYFFWVAIVGLADQLVIFRLLWDRFRSHPAKTINLLDAPAHLCNYSAHSFLKR